MEATIIVKWQEGEKRVIQHANGKYYPQRHLIRSNGLDWQYEPEYKSYKTVTGAKKSFK